MCTKIYERNNIQAIGIFSKGNEPQSMTIKILVARCRCGEKFFARVQNGWLWVEAEPMEDADVT